jgi:hypothetical protein
MDTEFHYYYFPRAKYGVFPKEILVFSQRKLGCLPSGNFGIFPVETRVSTQWKFWCYPRENFSVFLEENMM